MIGMDTHPHVEIVQVTNQAYLVDALGNACPYSRESGENLEQGHYVVTWPRQVEEPRFDQNARFYGPYSLALVNKLKAAEHAAAFVGRQNIAANSMSGARNQGHI